ncbi:MAG: PIN domain-containing protein [Acidiferrobacter sp.]
MVAKMRGLGLVPVMSAAILAEYADVLRRPRFGFPQDWVDELLADIQALALHVRPTPIATINLPDTGDASFLAAAKTADCPIAIGNTRHFPVELGVEILSPAACLGRLFKD